MAVIHCPGCGTDTELAEIRRDASEFCRVCDYPLFWADWVVEEPEPEEVLVGAEDDAAARLRLPGAGGMRGPGGVQCPVCDEINPPEHTYCSRCGSNLRSVPEPEPEPEPVDLDEPWEPALPGWLYPVLGLLVTGVGIAGIVIRLFVD